VDLTGIATRALVAYVVLLILVRASGKNSVRHGTTFDFIISVVIGDIVDDAILAEVAPVKFLVAAVALFVTHWSIKYVSYRANLRAPGQG
jgi:uncharacterized membrane protein YcaP (DUF421 family)